MKFIQADFLNKHCHCKTLDKEKLEYPQFFSPHPHFIAEKDLKSIGQFIGAYERLLTHEDVRTRFLSRLDQPAGAVEAGIFNSYDFHIGNTGPQLIEINSNAAGAVVSLFAAEKILQCCNGILDAFAAGKTLTAGEPIIRMFREEYALRFPGKTLHSVAIVDEDPTNQFFYPEFLLMQKLLRRNQIEAVIAAPADIRIEDDTVYAGEIPVDFIYNRTTDFYFENDSSQLLKEVYERGLVTVSPNPAVHALYANKANLAHFWSPAAAVLPAEDVAVVRAHLPETKFVTPGNAEALWQQRKEWFFKPVEGFGGKGVYRGDKLTSKVWQHIRAGGYIAQKYIVPRERQVAPAESLKYDVRVYAYRGKILGLMARYYQGQTTNFRTASGGLAHVLVAA
jgi:hypothetical protein